MEDKNVNVAEVENENIEPTEVQSEVIKPTLKERVAAAPGKVGGCIKRHWKGMLATGATIGGILVAGGAAMKLASDYAKENPLSIDGAVNAVNEAVDSVTEG